MHTIFFWLMPPMPATPKFWPMPATTKFYGPTPSMPKFQPLPPTIKCYGPSLSTPPVPNFDPCHPQNHAPKLPTPPTNSGYPCYPHYLAGSAQTEGGRKHKERKGPSKEILDHQAAKKNPPCFICKSHKCIWFKNL